MSPFPYLMEGVFSLPTSSFSNIYGYPTLPLLVIRRDLYNPLTPPDTLTEATPSTKKRVIPANFA
eukprot:scaffold309928_cov12-Tisochrysis_lutea.AAC.1